MINYPVLGDPRDREDRIALFVDGGHCEQITAHTGFRFDFRKLMETFSREGAIICARYYAPATNRRFDQARIPLQDWLRYNSYEVLEDGSFTRGPLVRLAVDAMEFSGNIDHFVIVSGDAGFGSLTDALHRHGAFVTAVSTVITTPPLIAGSFRRAADRFLDIGQMTELIGLPARGHG